MNKQAVFEAAKELARVILFATIGFVIGYVTDLPQNTTTGVVLLLLRAVDKYLHENPEVKLNGLAPF